MKNTSNIDINMKQGTIFLVTAPSGAGKSSLVKALLAKNSHIDLSISYTTRAKRDGEIDGREYNFISIDSFKTMQEHGEFVESAYVHGNYYGTSKIWLEQELSNHKTILLEIDWQGANQVKKIFNNTAHVVYIFILPPSIDELQRRLVSRGQDSAEVIDKRIEGAYVEMPHAMDADYIIINQNFDEAVHQLHTIVAASTLYSDVQFEKNNAIFDMLNISKN
jgi:guanylate kinase